MIIQSTSLTVSSASILDYCSRTAAFQVALAVAEPARIQLVRDDLHRPLPYTRIWNSLLGVNVRLWKKEISPMTLDIDWSECPIVQRNPNKLSGRPTVRSNRVPADAVVDNFDSGLPDDEIAYQFGLPIEDVRTILAYAVKYRQTAHAHLS